MLRSAATFLLLAAAARAAGVFYTMDYNWGGEQHYIPNVGNNTCYSLPPGVSSIGPDLRITCYGWLNDHCAPSNRFGPVIHPGVKNAEDWKSHADDSWFMDFNDAVRSIQCLYAR
ncbi:hypothetical protein EXIGLDRAFT_732069 [Exidia glandulosa HHB12029]|uniref:Beta/gamma crystallin 'Greek key' domain-containing protein n=1 Tax=Exidia glandulosa HHB12029 TaxID=1314781 RepID=A0A165BNJ0_EXIGL|nr:hypothetical protein EXIGLDRAFT_732069 [Exidia glandulosa HHB12029]